MNLSKVTMKYGRLIVFIRHDSAEIWGFRYGLTLVIGTIKIMASTGVFVRVVCALKDSIENIPSQHSMILT
jgi:mevalonate kinase